ncbi:flagellar hook-basal body complex protein FliE [Pseudomonas putida]|nr:MULTISPECIES: flagellar hook-basal body complex protein FliE [Pseudomonas]EKT4475221.1 flagellar hook-basal body complex protein FliE [Pseudomonas putida]MCX2708197.1 flagellar hook-basal body complex protein FliE [Pseudomonas sp. DCB_BG]PTV59757.1 flagellar hook-basal body complex protein FliE [Pseudomonas putida]HDS1725031.1 flagellar hook-basal body complex protein FliE [Pseudomonas putida]
MVQTIKMDDMLLDMRAMRSASALSIPAHQAQASASQTGFSDLFKQALEKVHQNQQASGQFAKAFEVGNAQVDLTQVMIASQKASVSTQALVQVRNKVVQAYQDIMQMPV